MIFFRLSKSAGEYKRELTPYEYENCKNDTIILIGDDCVTKALDFFIKIQKRSIKSLK